MKKVGQFAVKKVDQYLVKMLDHNGRFFHTSPWENATASSDKLAWVKKYLGKEAYKRLILSHHKHLNNGDYLIDDRDKHNGADKFKGELIVFDSPS